MSNDVSKWFSQDIGAAEVGGSSKSKKIITNSPKSRGFSKGQRAKKLDSLNLSLKEEFVSRDLKRSDYVDYCERLGHPVNPRTVTTHMSKKWKDLSTTNQIKYISFFLWADK